MGIVSRGLADLEMNNAEEVVLITNSYWKSPVNVHVEALPSVPIYAVIVLFESLADTPVISRSVGLITCAE
jgi:hypothetical protein